MCVCVNVCVCVCVQVSCMQCVRACEPACGRCEYVCVLIGFLFLRVFLRDQVIAGTIVQNRVWMPIFFNE